MIEARGACKSRRPVPLSLSPTDMREGHKKFPCRSEGIENSNTVHPSLKERAEAETSQVTPAKLPYGTRTNPLSAAISLS